MAHYVYVIECENGSYYTGYTTDIERRYNEHLKGTKKCHYTRCFPPKKLAAYWLFDSKSKALNAEYRLKKLKKHQKTYFINHCTLNNFEECYSFIKNHL